MTKNLFDFNTKEIMKNSVEATDLNNRCRQIIVEENNSLHDTFYEMYRDQSILNDQVVGVEYR
jgi:hypothetical protein